MSAMLALKVRLKRLRIPILRRLATAYFAWRHKMTELGKYRRWIAAGRPVPPPSLYKQLVVREAGSHFGLRVLVETGTFEGQMVEAVHDDFAAIYTIELDPALGRRAAERFSNRPHVVVLQGDSSQLLPGLLSDITEPAVFWLDAHYSGGPTAMGTRETPIMEELSAIAGHSLHRRHVILIDDAREFTGGSYPEISSLRRWAHANGFSTVEVEGDIIRIHDRAGEAMTPQAHLGESR